MAKAYVLIEINKSGFTTVHGVMSHEDTAKMWTVVCNDKLATNGNIFSVLTYDMDTISLSTKPSS